MTPDDRAALLAEAQRCADLSVHWATEAARLTAQATGHQAPAATLATIDPDDDYEPTRAQRAAHRRTQRRQAARRTRGAA